MNTEHRILLVVTQYILPRPGDAIYEELALADVVHVEPLLAGLLQIQADVVEIVKHLERKNMDVLEDSDRRGPEQLSLSPPWSSIFSRHEKRILGRVSLFKKHRTQNTLQNRTEHTYFI
jgi:hypothetical protein